MLVLFPTLENETNKALHNPNTAEHNNRSHEQPHDALAYGHRLPEEATSPTVTQSLDMNFPTTDSAIYSHSLVSSLASNTRPARIITDEVMIAQPTLPEHILQTQADEPAFLADSAIVVSSPLEIVHGSLGEVANGVGGMASESLIIENEMTYFK
jgi:hypothetical protein